MIVDVRELSFAPYQTQSFDGDTLVVGRHSIPWSEIELIAPCHGSGCCLHRNRGANCMSTESITVTPDFVWPEPDDSGDRTRKRRSHRAGRSYQAVRSHQASAQSSGRSAVIEQYVSIGPGQGRSHRADAVIGRGASIGQDAVIGQHASIGQGASHRAGHNHRAGVAVIEPTQSSGRTHDPSGVGWADGYHQDLCAPRRCCVHRAAAAIIGREALRHWENHEEDRQDT